MTVFLPLSGSGAEQFPLTEPECGQCGSLHLPGHCGGIQGDQNIRQVNIIITIIIQPQPQPPIQYNFKSGHVMCEIISINVMTLTSTLSMVWLLCLYGVDMLKTETQYH